jgi:hypothetical protein
MNHIESQQHASNPDPLTGEAGSHPVSTGVGAASGGLAGAALGAVGGPVAAAAGAVVGAVVGGLTGKGFGEGLNPTEDETYWREAHSSQPYVTPNDPYESYATAYRVGYEGHGKYAIADETFEDAEPKLMSEYLVTNPVVNWERARAASRAAWLRRQERVALAGHVERSAGNTSDRG